MTACDMHLFADRYEGWFTKKQWRCYWSWV